MTATAPLTAVRVAVSRIPGVIVSYHPGAIRVDVTAGTEIARVGIAHMILTGIAPWHWGRITWRTCSRIAWLTNVGGADVEIVVHRPVSVRPVAVAAEDWGEITSALLEVAA